MDRVLINKSRLVNNRTIFGRICILASLIALSGIFDGLISSYLMPANNMDMIRGRSMEMIGKVYGNVTSVNDLSFTSDSPELMLFLDNKLFSGYWLGDGMWRGELKADSSLRPGRYQIKINFHDLSNIKPDARKKVEKLSTYTVNVYSDAKALRMADLSLIKRFTGISPWLISIFFFPIVLISGGLIFIISGKLDTDMAQNGLAEIYRVSKHDSGLEVFFGLGKNHGLEAGEKMHLFNESGALVTEIVVDNIGNENSSAVVDISLVRPGCMVARIDNGEVICRS